MSFYSDASLVMIPSGYKTSKVYSAVPTSGDGDLVFSRSNDTATRVASNGLIEKVRTNLVLNSATFVTQTITVTANPHTLSFTGTGTIVATGVGSGTLVGTGASNRVSLSFTTTAGSLILTLTGTATLAQLETGDIATDYIATTTAAVSVGPVANVPRLDYLNSSCPRLLLEPQRTNLITYSEQPDNAAWTKRNSTISANSAISPDGYTNADKIQEDTTNDRHDIYQEFSVTSGTAYTISAFVKAAERTFCFLSFGSSNVNASNAFFNLSTGAVVSSPAGVTSTITSYGNGWYRITSTATAGITGLAYVVNGPSTNGTTISYQGVSGSGILVYGCAAEAGAYATSYIPTLGASVTRGADAASKTGISSLIGQTEGAFMIDVNLDNRASYTYFAIAPDLASGANYLGIGLNASSIVFESVTSSVLQAGITLSNSATGRFKIAVAYKANDFVMYVNGTQIGTDTSGSVPTCSQVGLYEYGQTPSVKYNQSLLFKTRLTNQELLDLTTL